MIEKKNVSFKILADKIKELNAISWIIISAYTVEEAKFRFAMNKDILPEAFNKNEKNY